jgi:hypothetical protein
MKLSGAMSLRSSLQLLTLTGTLSNVMLIRPGDFEQSWSRISVPPRCDGGWVSLDDAEQDLPVYCLSCNELESGVSSCIQGTVGECLLSACVNVFGDIRTSEPENCSRSGERGWPLRLCCCCCACGVDGDEGEPPADGGLCGRFVNDMTSAGLID